MSGIGAVVKVAYSLLILVKSSHTLLREGLSLYFMCSDQHVKYPMFAIGLPREPIHSMLYKAFLNN